MKKLNLFVFSLSLFFVQVKAQFISQNNSVKYLQNCNATGIEHFLTTNFKIRLDSFVSPNDSKSEYFFDQKSLELVRIYSTWNKNTWR